VKRATFCVVAVLLLGCWYQPVSQAQSAKQPLVGTWLLTSEQLNADSSQPTPAQGARGMLVFDAAGHYFEIVDRAVPEALAKDLSEAQASFYRVGGSWGRYEVNSDTGRISFEAFAGRSPNITGAKFSRSFAVASVPDDQDRLTVTSLPGELHALAVTRRVWQRVPPMMGLSAEARQVVDHAAGLVAKRCVQRAPNRQAGGVGHDYALQERFGIATRDLDGDLVVDVEHAHRLARRAMLFGGRREHRRRGEAQAVDERRA